MEYTNKLVTELIPYASNARTHSEEQVTQIASSIREFGFINPIIIDDKNNVIAGHGRLLASKKLGLKEVPTLQVDHLTDTQRKAYILADNQLALNAGWDTEMLKLELAGLDDVGFDLELLGFDLDALGGLFDSPSEGESPNEGEVEDEYKKVQLSDTWGVPPFSVLDARGKLFQQRANYWYSKGLKSNAGRFDLPENVEDFKKELKNGKAIFLNIEGAIPFYYDKKRKGMTDQQMYDDYKDSNMGGTSIFNPALCEILIQWYCPKNGNILDPFAGGSVRGFIASQLGMKYTGIDLSESQIKANRDQWEILDKVEGCTPPIWIHGDSATLDELLPLDYKAEFAITCPPYADLEVYSDDPRDISSMCYDDFKKAYTLILQKTYNRLDNNSFFAIVVGEVRSKKGNYYNFLGDTVNSCLEAGFKYENEAVLLTAVGSNAMRANRVFTANRRLIKTHQNVLIFIKGDIKKAAAKLSPPNFVNITDEDYNDEQ